MSDIVERLRELEAVESNLACECDCPPEATANYRYAMTCAEAADEITRLRNELHIAQEWSARVIAGHEQDINEITALRTENERLRAALQWFVDEYDKVQPMRQARVHAPDCRCVLCAYENARAALNDQPAPGKEE